MKFKNLKPEIKDKAMRLCSRREYCCKEIFDKAVSWGCSPAEANELIDYLVERKFLDDSRYAEAFVRDKLRFNKWGRVKIAYMLRVKSIDNNTITDVFSRIDEAEYNEVLNDELQKKYRTLRGNIFEIKGKLFRFAAGRGFEAEIINEAISQLFD